MRNQLNLRTHDPTSPWHLLFRKLFGQFPQHVLAVYTAITALKSIKLQYSTDLQSEFGSWLSAANRNNPHMTRILRLSLLVLSHINFF